MLKRVRLNGISRRIEASSSLATFEATIIR